MVGQLFSTLAGCSLTEEQLRDIPYPKFELTIHVTTKTTQALAIIAGGVIAPVVHLIKRNKDSYTLYNRCYKYGCRGFLVGFALGPALTIMRCSNQSEESIYDRCYRIRRNDNQMRVDRLSILGALAGAGLIRFAGAQVGKGLLLGYSSGCIAGGAYNIAKEKFQKIEKSS